MRSTPTAASVGSDSARRCRTYRGRGAQSAILAARIEDARRQGCGTVVTETGELADDRPSSSYRNILRAGFRETGVRPNYRAPSV